ncbi:MAG: GNAT family N-acetyltransferase [Bacteroidales bacterium]
MEEIISPVDKEILKSELTPERFLRSTRKGNNEIYIFKAQDCPKLMLEIGRLREIAFRHAGGGTGKSVDIDEFDTMEEPYWQLIVWNPEDHEILGGYRYILGRNVKIDEHGHPVLATGHMFGFSQQFLQEYLPHTIELGRSFVTLEYQSSRAGSRGLFALDNLWDGLGALTVDNREIKYFYGKFTMYPTYSIDGRNMILYFLQKHFPDNEGLVFPFSPLETNIDTAGMQALFPHESFKDDYKVLNQEVRKLGYNIPPLVNAYMSLSPTMKMFGTAINDEFGDVEESGILITVDEIDSEKRARYIETYERYLEERNATLLEEEVCII